MSAGLLRYREWHGRFRGPFWSVWPVARVALGMVLRRRLFWAIYAFGLLLFLMFFFGSLLLDWLETQLPVAPIQVGNFRAEPDRLVGLVRQGLRILNGSQETFAYFFVYQGSVVMVMLALAGSVLVGNDFTYRSLGFYLGKPLSRWHYIAGKCLAVAVVVHLLTTLPAVVLFVQHGLDDWDYFANPAHFHRAGDLTMGTIVGGPAGLHLLAGILGFGLMLSVFLSILLVAVASWMRRTMPMVMIWSTLFLFFKVLAGILVDGLHYDARWRLIDLWNDLSLVGFACLGYSEDQIWPAPQPSMFEAGLVLAGVCCLCLSYLNLRTRAVEIVS
jgi:hypothetical protein